MDPTHPLHGKRVAVATMHGKQAVLVPPLAGALALRAEMPANFDSDAFGTFTGDVPRLGSPLEAARRKARAAMAILGVRLAVASEGTFGPHPQLPFVPLAAELVLLLDDELGIEVIAEDVGTATNFAGIEVRSLAEAEAFATRIGFPSHQLVLSVDGDPSATVRGIGDGTRLATELHRRLQQFGRARLATDMRADRNPTRMLAIGRAAARLAERAACRCPSCGWPGFGQIAVERGLPCAACGEPTELVGRLVHGCANCAERHSLPRPDGRLEADPGSCPSCNP